MMAERGILVDHSTVHRWALKLLAVLAALALFDAQGHTPAINVADLQRYHFAGA
jgi:transposase-like protein